MIRPTGDDEARKRIGDDFGSDLFVEAGAGTGKTTCLVKRLIRMLTHEDSRVRVGIEEIAAITFTEKAAAELKERIRRELDGQGDNSYAKLAIGGLEGAAIETIHAFAARILRMTALETGLPAAFDVRDAIQSDVSFEEWWEETLEDLLLAPENEALWGDFLQAGLKLNHARQFAQKLQGLGHRLEQPIPAPAPDYEGFRKRLEELVRLDCLDPTDLMHQRLENLKPTIVELGRASTAKERLAVLASVVLPGGAVGRKANWRDLDQLRADLVEIREQLETLQGEIAGSMVIPVLELIRKKSLAYLHERYEKGELEFQDLLIFAAEALESRTALARVRDRFTRILVDEFQDTDPLQLDIVEKIAAGEPERLFFVGDPRQSIYRFRGAELEAYVAKRDGMGEAKVARLTNNFRSTQTIIGWVNQAFHGAFGSVAGELADLECGKDDAGEKVRLLGEPLLCHAEDVRIAEAEALARALLELRSKGRELSDVAILFPSRAILYFIEREFEKRGIPYRVESKSLLFETQEARDLFTVLRAVEDPSDSIAIVGALRTPTFCCSDQEIYEHSRVRSFNYLNPDTLALEGKIAGALSVLAELHDARFESSVGSLAARIVEEGMLLESGLASGRPRDVWQRYSVLLDQVRAFDESTHGTLRQFLSWAKTQTERELGLSERIVSEKDDQSVRLMTIHAAKGLEFPVVFVGGLGGGEYFEPGLRVTWADDGLCFRAKAGDYKVHNQGALSAFEEEQRRSDLERERVLYVACTRAEELLVVSQFRTASNAMETIENGDKFRCLAKRIEDRLPNQDLGLWIKWEPEEAGAEFSPEAWPAPPTDSIADWLKAREEAFSRDRLIHRAATEVAATAHELLTEEPPDEPSRPRGRGTNFGLAVHGALQMLNLKGDARLREVARAQASANGVGAEPVIRAVEAALDSAPVQTAARCGGLKEVFASAKVEGVLLEGILDLVYEDVDGLHVIDYKTNADASPSGRADAMKSYRLQGGSYALMLEATTGRKVVDCKFLFLMGGPEAIETLEEEDLERAMAEVREALASGVTVDG